MQNIAKHSRADQIRIVLSHNASGEIQLIVADNGKGFDADQTIRNESEIASSGLGLINMQERVAFSGGLFSLESQPGLGTTLTATWPSAKNSEGQGQS